MSSSSALDELLKLTVVGLQNSSSYDQVLPEAVQAVIANKTYANDSARFLDAAALTSLQAELSQIPTADDFDELPDILDETRVHLNANDTLMVERLFNHQSKQPGRTALILLQRYGYAIPDTLFCDLMEAQTQDKSGRWLLASVAGARARWLTEMNGSWRAQLGEALQGAPVSQVPIIEQYRLLAETDAEALQETCRNEWDNCAADTRRLLLGYLRSAHLRTAQLRSNPSEDETELGDWIVDHLNDKSTHVRRELTRWLITLNHPQGQTLRENATALLLQFMDVSKPRKPDLTVPEELSEAWTQLAIVDQDYLDTNLPKPVQRLGQLLVLTGPACWGAALKCKSHDALYRLLKSRFGEELEPYLWEACLLHRDWSGLTEWCKRVKLKEHSPLPGQLKNSLQRLGPAITQEAMTHFVNEESINLLLAQDLWQLLSDFRCPLTGPLAHKAFEQWSQHALKHRYYFDSDTAAMMPLWLDLEQPLNQFKGWQAIRKKEKFSNEQMDFCESLFGFKTALQQHALQQARVKHHHEDTRS